MLQQWMVSKGDAGGNKKQHIIYLFVNLSSFVCLIFIKL